MVEFNLGDGQEVARHAPADWQAGGDIVTVGRASQRCPIRTTISAERAAFAAWNALPPVPLLAAGGGLGAIFGLLLGRLLDRRGDATANLDAAIAARAFRPFYQPIFTLEDRTVTGCEILMRWVLPDGRILPPAAFIPVAESTGRIETMTWLILEQALAELRPVLDRDPSVNIVPGHLLAPRFPSTPFSRSSRPPRPAPRPPDQRRRGT